MDIVQSATTELMAFLYQQGISVTQGLLNALVDVATFTSAPNNWQNYFQNPTNGEWPGLYEISQGTPKTAAVIINILASVIIVGGWRYNFFSHQLLVRMLQFNLLGWLYYFIGWEIRAFILSTVKFVTEAFVTVQSSPSLAEAGLSGLVIIAAALIAWVNFWAVLAILTLLAGRLIALDVLTAYLTPLLALRALPLKVVSKFGETTNNFWQFLVLFPLPIGLILSVGFSDTARQAVQEIGGPAISGVMLVAAQLGSIVAALAFSYGLFTQHQVSATIGVAGFSAAGGGQRLKSGYERQRERASDFGPESRPSTPLPAKNFKRGFQGTAPMGSDGDGVLEPPRSWRYGKSTRRIGAAIRPTSGNSGGGSGGSDPPSTPDGGSRISSQNTADVRSSGVSGERTATTPSTGGNAGASPTMNDTRTRNDRTDRLKQRKKRIEEARPGYRKVDRSEDDDE